MYLANRVTVQKEGHIETGMWYMQIMQIKCPYSRPLNFSKTLPEH